MYTVKQLKAFLEKLPDDMPVGILDTSTDDEELMNYPLSEDNLIVEDYYDNDALSDNYGECLGQMLFIGFNNKMNDNPI